MSHGLSVSLAVVAALGLVTSAARAEEQRTYELSGFDEVAVEGVYEAYIEVGPGFSVELSGDEAAMAEVDVRVEGDRLVLGVKEGGRRDYDLGDGREAPRAVVTLPALTALSMSGVGAVEADGIDADAFTADLEGVGSVELAGRCRSLTASVEGIGSLDAKALRCATVEVRVEGIGSAEVHADRAVSAAVDGLGSIEVWGSPDEVARAGSPFSSITLR